jgi:hypothetical protein
VGSAIAALNVLGMKEAKRGMKAEVRGVNGMGD